MNIVLRSAEKRDCERLLQLVQELAAYERASDKVTVTLQDFEESGFGDKPIWWALVASNKSNEDEIVGFALYYIRFSTWKGQRMYLEDFVVTEKARGKGIGKLLFDKLITECRNKNFSGIVWQVLNWNESAINFYKKYYNATLENEWLNCSIEI